MHMPAHRRLCSTLTGSPVASAARSLGEAEPLVQLAHSANSLRHWFGYWVLHLLYRWSIRYTSHPDVAAFSGLLWYNPHNTEDATLPTYFYFHHGCRSNRLRPCCGPLPALALYPAVYMHHQGVRAHPVRWEARKMSGREAASPGLGLL
jgi:hypothetical protein